MKLSIRRGEDVVTLDDPALTAGQLHEVLPLLLTAFPGEVRDSFTDARADLAAPYERPDRETAGPIGFRPVRKGLSWP